KNLLAVIQGMARQTAATSLTTADFLNRFAARLQSLAGSHDLLVQENWQSASMVDLVRSQLGHYFDEANERILFSGPQIRLKPEAVQNIGMALHELATNAAKYGALSAPSGRVTIEWQVEEGADGAPRLRICWEEEGGPRVTEPQHKGFGRVVTE